MRFFQAAAAACSQRSLFSRVCRKAQKALGVFRLRSGSIAGEREGIVRALAEGEADRQRSKCAWPPTCQRF